MTYSMSQSSINEETAVQQHESAAVQGTNFLKVLEILHGQDDTDKLQTKEMQPTSSSNNTTKIRFGIEIKKQRSQKFPYTCPFTSRRSITTAEETYGVRLDKNMKLCDGPHVILLTHLLRAHKMPRSSATQIVGAIQTTQIEQLELERLEEEMQGSI
ncbi:unnamed protein product [Didymodactylos carnosus]|uniref:Uncharacterized protein n=1 Tax=Didymodactylos carnosus TaxID=1234261 RepID=A0A8S2K3U0_9BILA|nr:unnamed protein product [Didymodactylos carnosus]CAF3837626.1 unnamed protein product [Didymodactylos carnosus]